MVVGGRGRAGLVTYTETGEPVQIEIQSDGYVPISGSRPIGQLAEVFAPVRQVASALLKSVASSEVRPDEVTVSFGISVDGTGEAVVSKTGTEGTFAVTLTWRASQ
ncbi:MAG: hypothetical protein HOW97_02260 [Catenulispora sp.]|nr:hypothetical protein [Catenulispora sp.]